jgi:hypothetical protein
MTNIQLPSGWRRTTSVSELVIMIAAATEEMHGSDRVLT